MVPNGWEHKAFGEVVKLSKSKYDPKKSTDCFPCIELEHIVQETGQLTGNVPASNLGSTKNKFKAGDVIFGKLRPYLRKYAQPNFDGVCSSEIWVFSPTKKIINSYLFQLVQTNQFISEANKSAGSKMPRADWGVVSEMIFPLPPLPEQKKIAQILSTWDKAITTTEQLLANSQQQKKALMQQLLTGKKRLLEKNGVRFSGEWRERLLGDISKITTGSSNRQDSHMHGAYTFFDRSEDIRTSDTYLFDCEAVIVPGEGQDFIPKYFVGKFDLHQRTYAIMDFPECHGKFLFYAIHYFRSHFLSQAVGSTVKSLRLPMFQKMKLKLPMFEEQQKIAAVLSTADQEITALQQKLDALKQEKKALMQQLLTGKRRVTLN